MKMNVKYLMLVGLLIFISCADDEDDFPMAASLKIVNAVVDAGTLEVKDFDGNLTFFGSRTIGFGSNVRFTLPINSSRDIIIVQAEDTLNTLLNEPIVLDEAGGIYSLFLTGDASNVETMLIRDEYLNYQDSLVGLRFINLSPGSLPISVGIMGETENLVSGLEYRNVSDFNQLDATTNSVPYTFEFKDSDGNVLITKTIDPLPPFGTKSVFQNLTLVMIGLPNLSGGSDNLSIAVINHF